MREDQEEVTDEHSQHSTGRLVNNLVHCGIVLTVDQTTFVLTNLKYNFYELLHIFNIFSIDQLMYYITSRPSGYINL